MTTHNALCYSLFCRETKQRHEGAELQTEVSRSTAIFRHRAVSRKRVNMFSRRFWQQFGFPSKHSKAEGLKQSKHSPVMQRVERNKLKVVEQELQ